MIDLTHYQSSIFKSDLCTHITGEIRDKRPEWQTDNLIVLVHPVVKVCAIPVESAFGDLHIEPPFIILSLFGSEGTLHTALHLHITCSETGRSSVRDN